MELRSFLLACGLGLFGILIVFLLPSFGEPSLDDYPWHIETTNDGNVRVLGLEIGRDTLLDARRRIGETDVSLFAGSDGGLSMEIFFANVNLGGLGSRIVITAEMEPDELQASFDRGLRITSVGEGHRVTPHPHDVEYAGRAPIASLTYMPRIRIEQETLRGRFGEPEEVIQEAGTTELWLYPRKGLTIAVDSSGRRGAVIQFQPPRSFDHSYFTPASLEAEGGLP